MVAMAGDATERRMEGRTWRLRLCLAVLLLACSLGLRALMPRMGSSLFPTYRHLTRAVMGFLAALTGVVPFALWDVAALVGVVVTVVVLVRGLRGRGRVLPWLSWVALAGSVAAFLFVGWACNHYAPPLANELGLEVDQYSTDDLAQATAHYLREAAKLADQVPRDEDGTLLEQDFGELARIAGASYASLGEDHDVLRGSQAPVKALLVWGEPLLYSGHTGMFFAPTGESGVPVNVAPVELPFTMCHEAAHRLGLASEQEANFAAYLACAASDDVRLRYSGAYNAFVYCWNALYAADGERAVQLLQDAAEGDVGEGVVLVWADRLATHEAYDAYEGTFEKVGATVNDTYLKSFGESSGVRSYGLVVDLLITWQQQ
jgi:hypothetical protein